MYFTIFMFVKFLTSNVLFTFVEACFFFVEQARYYKMNTELCL